MGFSDDHKQNQSRWRWLVPQRPEPFGVLILAVLFLSTAQAERLPLKNYTTAEGLAHNDINKIVRDSRGFLWFCTANGLSRFDGYSFINFGTDQGLPHAGVTDLLETRSGEYWVATGGGLVLFNPRGAPARQVSYLNDHAQPAPMFAVLIPEDQDRRARALTVLLEDREGTIWCGSLKGLWRLQRVNERRTLQRVEVGIPNDFPEQGFVSDILQDSFGTLWIATPSGLYRRWGDGSAVHYTKADGLPNEFISDLMEDHQQQLWVATRLGGFFRLIVDATHKPPSITQAFSNKDGLPTPWIFQMFESANHRFWLATARGLVEFFPNADQPKAHFHSYTTRNGLSYYDITALNEDLAGNLWLGTNTTGAMRLARDGFITYDEQEGLLGVNAIFPDRSGGVCFRGLVLGTGTLSVFEGAKLNLLRTEPDNSFPRLGSFDDGNFNWFKPDALSNIGWVLEGVTLLSHDGEWWVGSGAGLYRFPVVANFAGVKSTRPLAVYANKEGLASGQIFRLFEDSRGDIWVSTISSATNGLARWEHATNTMRDLAGAPGLPSVKDDLPRSISEDQSGNVWVGFNTGVARYAEGSFKFFSADAGLPPGAIMNMFRDSANRLWLASARSGLIRVDNPTSSQPAFVSYTTAQGLSSNNTEVITEDLHGYIYVGGGSGLDRLDPATGRVKHFTTADGLAQGTLRAAFRDRAGTLWFGTTRGLSRFTPPADEPSGPPPVLITGLRVAGSPRTVSALGEIEMHLPDFAASENQLQLDFIGLDFGPGDVLKYQYKLEGADRDWGAPTEQRSVNYAQLASGHYRFLVRAVDSEGHVTVNPASVSFTILPHIYQRWWFLTLAALTLIMISYAWYRSRMARLLGLERVRTRIAADLHDDLGSNLTRIAILSEVASQQTGDSGAAADSPLLSIARISRESVESMSDIVWAINPKRDSLLDLVLRMRTFAGEIFANGKIECQFRAPETGQDQKLGADLRRDFFLIFKEALNNAVRHSGCARVEIDLRLTPRWIELRVKDNGRGFDPSSSNEGHGLLSMQRRAKALGGELRVLSGPGSGTEILLRAARGTVSHYGNT